MNYQTKEVSDWLDKSGVLNSRREDISKLQKLVELSLLVKGKDIHPNDYITNVAITEFLKHVQWEELIYNPSAWDDYEYKDEEDIDTSDIPELDENFWEKAQLVEPKTA